MKRCLLVCMFLFAVAHAEMGCQRGWYFGGIGGVNFADFDKEDDGRTDFHPGYYIGGDFGYRLIPYLRGEVEIAYRENRLDKLTILDVDIPSNGSVTTYTYFANLYLDLNFGYCFYPFVGFGLGKRDSKIVLNVVDPSTSQLLASFEGTDNRSVGQGIAGICYIFRKNSDVCLEYRYLHIDSNERNHSVGLSLKGYF